MKLVKILSDKVQIRSDYKEFDDVRINDLIAVSDGEVELVTMVNTLTDIDTENEEEIGENDYILEHSSTKMLECSIIGTVKDGTFQKAIDKYPTMKVSAHRISKEEFASMLSRYTEGFCIGEYSAYEFPAYVDGNKFFQRHACIVGNTGAGKSETVAKILEQTSKLPGANVIVFDIHGEYKELSYARNIQIGGDRPFPIWMFGFTDMISNILKIKEESATVAMTALRKCYYNVCPKGKENRPVYFNYCGVCGKARQKKINSPYFHKTVWCICDCRVKELEEQRRKEEYEEEMHRVQRLKDASMMASKFRDAEFSVYQKRTENQRAYDVSRKYAAQFRQMITEGNPKTGEKNLGLVFYGPCGTGKSFTAACIANELMEQNISVVMTSFVKILQDIQGQDEAA